jgi:glutamate-1-semialdehyde aminotransferase
MDWKNHHRAQDCIAQGYLTNSKRPESLVKGIYPTHVSYGNRCYLYDPAGKKHMDFICGLGTNILGYGHPTVAEAISKQALRGASLSLATTLELDAAELLKQMFVFADCWKFTKSGTEACAAAIKIARAHTGRPVVLSDGYHGWSDTFVSLSPPALGCPPSEGLQVRKFEDLNQIDGSVAAVIVEPVQLDWSQERMEYLQALRDACTKAGALLIFDEIITGFRFLKWSVSSYSGVVPDLICLGKAIANGMPLAAVGGKYATMNSAEYFVSGTYAGETISLAAGIATMKLLMTKYKVDYLWERGMAWLEKFNSMHPLLRIQGYPTRGAFVGDLQTKALFWQEACKAGMIFGPSWFWNFPLLEDTATMWGPIEAITSRLYRGEIKLEGELPKSPFAASMRKER